MKVSQAFELPYPWQKVAEVMCDPDFNCDREKLRDATVSCVFEPVDEGELATVFELRAKEHKRKKTGGLDKGTTIETVTKCRWDVKARQQTWDYFGQDARMKLSGIYKVEPLGEEKTRFTHEVTIEVKIPLIGKQIAKMIAREFERPDDRYPKLMERYLDR